MAILIEESRANLVLHSMKPPTQKIHAVARLTVSVGFGFVFVAKEIGKWWTWKLVTSKKWITFDSEGSFYIINPLRMGKMVQAEIGSFPTSFIKTTDCILRRAAGYWGAVAGGNEPHSPKVSNVQYHKNAVSEAVLVEMSKLKGASDGKI